METKETSLRTVIGIEMLEDTEYYKYIFKKTEKMSCAVFYILRNGQSESHEDRVVYDLEKTSQALLDVSLESLKSTLGTKEERIVALKHALIAFESKLRVAHASRVLSGDLLEVFLHEIDSVQRSLRKYVEPVSVNPLMRGEATGETPSRERKPARVRIEGGTPQAQAHEHASATVSRRERVLNVLRDKGEATIKDIIEVVTDCSEKTIQRELISLIKDNMVLREGERRWSKYKLI